MANRFQRATAAALTLPLLSVGVLTAIAPAAQAAGCGGMTICGDTGDGPNEPTPGGSVGGNTGGGNTGGGSSGGGSSSVPADPYAYSVRLWGGGDCAVRDDGKAAKGAVYYYTKKFDYSTDKDTNPGGGHVWTYAGYFPSYGHMWSRIANTGKGCLYPSRERTVSMLCSISYTVSIQRMVPKLETLATATKGTSYKENSRNYVNCVNSSGNQSLSVPIEKPGYYEVETSQRVQSVRAVVPYTRDDWTGIMANPRIVSVSPAFNTAKEVGMTASLDCFNGFKKNPGIKLPAWRYSEVLCQNTPKASYTCESPGVLVDVADDNARTMRSVNGKIQFMGDGKSRKVVWNQTIKSKNGANVKVQGYTTELLRSGTPWNPELPRNGNLTELSRTATSESVWASATGTGTIVGKANEWFVTTNGASGPDAPLKLTQVLTWKGTRTIESGVITSVNPNTGSIVVTPKIVTMPTSGTCSQSVTFDYVRIMGHEN